MSALKQKLAWWMASPRDLARWGFWVPLREALDPAHPERLRALYPLWRAHYAASRGQRQMMSEELIRCFGTDAALQDAYRIAFRVHLEELLLGKLTPETLGHYIRFEQRENLDRALARGKGAIILLPHAGNVMMMIALLTLRGYPYTQYAARGLAPDQVAAANPETFGINRWRKAVRETREANEDRLPAKYISLGTSVRALYRALKNNETVGIAFDGRIGSRFVPHDYLGRQALLSPGPYKLAARTGAAIVTALNSCPADGPNVCTMGEPLWGDDADELMSRALGEQVEPWLRAHQAEYGPWLAHCLERRAVDDHPLFIDYAPDQRYRRWMGA